MENLKQIPVLGSILNIFDTYPRISAWVVLSAGIIILLAIEAQDVGLSAGNWIALIIASIAVSGLCIWIVSWEDEDEATETVVKSEVKDEPPPSDNTDSNFEEAAAPEADTDSEKSDKTS